MVVRPAGIEPATTSLEGWGSLQLSYGRVLHAVVIASDRRERGNLDLTRREIASSLSLLAMTQIVVGARGFEPPTASSQSWCATRLRYAPTRKPGHLFLAPFIVQRSAFSVLRISRTFASARPRWLIRFFSSGVSSARVFPTSGT